MVGHRTSDQEVVGLTPIRLLSSG